MRSKSVSQEVWGFCACCGDGFTNFLFFFFLFFTVVLMLDSFILKRWQLKLQPSTTAHIEQFSIFLLCHDFSLLPGNTSSITCGAWWASWCYLWFTVLHWKNMGGPREITFASRGTHFPGEMNISRGENECCMDTGSAELTTTAAGGSSEAVTGVEDGPQLILCGLL